MSARTLENNLRHARQAYLHALRALPALDDIQSGPVISCGMTFYNEGQIKSQIIELGWAFYCRYETCLEAWLKTNDVILSRKTTIKSYLIAKGAAIPEDMARGMDIYRDIRNKLHHEDGAIMDNDVDSEKEIHLLEEHMDMFFHLFVYIGATVDELR
ncbi:hypothetical protein [Xanthobacter variabilis]|uniref:hypothetical protein n=1 Tax=Xanthobacter variabilis TaxID=3119932 RepID=UPI0037297801